jgi:hypothetical protein
MNIVCPKNNNKMQKTKNPTEISRKAEERYIKSLFISLNALNDATATIKLKNIIMRIAPIIIINNGALAPIFLAINKVAIPGTVNMVPSDISIKETIIPLPNNPTPAFLAHNGLDSGIT